MAIKKTADSPEEGKVTLEIDNGHLETLKKITEDFNIQDIEKALGFVLAVVSRSNGKPIKIGEDTFAPGEAIKKKPPSESSEIPVTT